MRFSSVTCLTVSKVEADFLRKVHRLGRSRSRMCKDLVFLKQGIRRWNPDLSNFYFHLLGLSSRWFSLI